jgi:hypothetical protein
VTLPIVDRSSDDTVQACTCRLDGFVDVFEETIDKELYGRGIDRFNGKDVAEIEFDANDVFRVVRRDRVGNSKYMNWLKITEKQSAELHVDIDID